MSDQKKRNIPYKTPTLVYGLLIIFGVACIVLLVALVHKADTDKRAKVPNISLGSMQYDFTSGRAIKRNDASVNTLKAFLETDAAHEGCPSGHPPYEYVIAYTKDETQIFIHYGCGAADSPMFATKVNGAWKMLSPTNHFDIFGIPSCSYLAANGISKEIAPVCANGLKTGLAASYSVR